MLHLDIDPMKIEGEEACELLKRLFERYQDVHVFSRHEKFRLDKTYVQLTKTVLRASSNQAEYHVLANRPLGSGGSSKIYSVESDMFVSAAQNAVTYNTPNPPRVVKYQYVTFSSDEDVDQKARNKWTHEYEQSRDGHLDAEIPLFKIHDLRGHTKGVDKYGIEMFLPMNRMPGIEFFSFLSWVLEPQSRVTSYFRFLLTFELLNKFYGQVARDKKVHGDLKPENMMFAMNIEGDYEKFVLNGGLSNDTLIPQWQINMIDFEASEYFNVPRKFFSCTKNYAAPETLVMLDDVKKVPKPTYPAVSDEKLDLVSIAIIIGIIWGLHPNEVKTLVSPAFSTLLVNRTHLFFSDESEAFCSSILAPIYTAIACMVNPNPSKRWNLEQSNMFFEDLFAHYNQRFLFKSVSRTTPVPERPDSVMFEGGADDQCSSHQGEETLQCTPVSMVSDQDDQDDIIMLDRKSPIKFFEPQPGRKATVRPEAYEVTCGCIIS